MQAKPLLLIALPACCGRAIGDNAIRRAVALSRYYQPVIISDCFPNNMPSEVKTIKVRPTSFSWMRRFCHVPNELSFAWAVRHALKNILLGERVTFFLCHGYTLSWFAGRWYRRKSGVPFGMFMHGHIFERPRGTYDTLLTAFYRAIAPICYREADLLLALSPAQADLAVIAGARRDRVKVAPNGLDLCDIGLNPEAVQRKIQSYSPKTPLRFLYVGRLSMEKGVSVLLKACALMRGRGLEFRLRIVGSGPEERSLRAMCLSLDMDDVVEFYGGLPRVALGVHYLEHDFLFVPSVTEPLGNVVLEGMACGCLVIGSDTGGISSMVRHGERGVLVPPGDPVALCAAVMELYGSSAITKMVRSAYEWQLEHADWRVVGERISKAIGSLPASKQC